MVSQARTPQTKTGRTSRRSPVRTARRIFLIDNDVELAEVVIELLQDNGVEVVHHICANDQCACAEAAAKVRPDLILVNVAQPSGWLADTAGLRSLRQIQSHPLTSRIAVLGFTIFDTDTLAEMGVDVASLGIPVRTGMSNPGRFADEVAHTVAVMPAA